MESTLHHIPDLRIIETIRCNDGVFQRLDRHLNRARRTCRALGFSYSEQAIREALDTEDGGDLRVRLTIARDGEVSVIFAPFQPLPQDTVWKIDVSDFRLDADATHLRFKTTERATYDQARSCLPSDIHELIFANRREEVCEGTITNIFADFGDGLVTPPVSSGLLPGVLREEMLETGQCSEAIMPLEQLKDAERLYVGNSLRGLITAEFNN